MANTLYFENVINSTLMTGNRPTEQRCRLLGIVVFGVMCPHADPLQTLDPHRLSILTWERSPGSPH